MFWRIEESLADVIVFNSIETREKYVSLGYFTDRQDRLAVFGNPSPSGFKGVTSFSNETEKPKKILLVSNHPPIEVEKARELLRAQGISVISFGTMAGGNPTRVLPEHIAEVDVVLTIGKTVQYSILAGIPVYCYDHFGGPGYLSSKNFQKARDLNFSGRGFKRKTADRIVKGIIEGYDGARKFALYAQTFYADEFGLGAAIDRIFETISKSPRLTRKPSLAKLDIEAYLNIMRIIERNVRGVTEIQSQTIDYLGNRVTGLELEIEDMQLQLHASSHQLQSIKNSVPYRLGTSLLMPLIAARKVTKRRHR